MSSKSRMTARRRAFVRLIAEIRHSLAQALEEEHSARGLTKAKIARILERHPSFITRKLIGTSNMTLETFADLAWALDRPIRISLQPRRALASNYGDETDAEAIPATPNINPALGASSSPPPPVHEIATAR